MKITAFIAVIVLLVAISSFDKEVVAPVKRTFAFAYKVVNQGSERNIERLAFHIKKPTFLNKTMLYLE